MSPKKAVVLTAKTEVARKNCKEQMGAQTPPPEILTGFNHQGLLYFLSLCVELQTHISLAESPLNQLFTVLYTYKSQEWTFQSISRCLLSNWGDLSSLTFLTHSFFDKGAVSNKYNPKLLQKSTLRASILSPPFFTAGLSFLPPALLFLLQLEFFLLWLIPSGSGLSGDHLHP